MLQKDSSDNNKLEVPKHVQPLPGPFVPKVKVFTFKTFMDIESQNKWLFQNRDPEVLAEVGLRK